MSVPSRFPATIWDGSSRTRSVANDHEAVINISREPDGDDYAQAVSEIIAIENALATVTTIAGAGNTAALATTATAGFFFVPKVAGTSTGVPANVPAGYLAMVYDSTNHKIGVYDSGAWKYTAALS